LHQPPVNQVRQPTVQQPVARGPPSLTTANFGYNEQSKVPLVRQENVMQPPYVPN